MVPQDLAYIDRLVSAGIIRGPCLELGAGLDGHNLRGHLERHGVEWYGSDLKGDGDRVFALDLESAATVDRTFATVVFQNVLEHTFDPVRCMDRALSLVAPGGQLVVSAPSFWDLHYFPIDCWRIMPGFLVEYAQRRNLTLLREHFMWVCPHLRPIRSDRPALPRHEYGALRYYGERLANKAMRAFGRGPRFGGYLSVGAVLVKP